MMTLRIRVFLFGMLLAFSVGAHNNDGSKALYENLVKLAQQENPEAQYHLGMMLNNGIGVDKNPKQAYQWFEKAARAGHPLAAYKLGCYLAGQFEGVVPLDMERALEYKLIAADAGYALAQDDVGITYFQQNQIQDAIRWWQAAAKQGHSRSLRNLSVAFKNGNGVPADNVLAYAYLKLAKLSSEGRDSSYALSTLDELKKILVYRRT